ncbi:reversion-inducing cysteine-rich protein with Kazal motifs-like isoform X1 [Mytilus trossulus]|uniref:reversion-inducing cysteine-rich protein with Kazal motifs-like isoform X1 n=2 Tax=Mytilus trossulus TaxID=6551 RepID=UPI0030048C10
MFGFTNMILFCVFIFLVVHNSQSLAFSCCDTVKEEGCKRACKQMVITGNQIEQIEQIIKTSKQCRSDQIEFWRCVNTSIPVAHSISQWNGRACCDLAVKRQCKEACQQSTSIEEVEEKCSKSTEHRLFSCLDKEEDGARCCRSSSDYSCQLVCQGMFAMESMTRQEQRQTLRGQCHSTSRTIMQCLQNKVKSPRDSNPIDSLPCCSVASNEECRKTCVKTLMTMKNNEQIVAELIKTCGPALPYVPIWGCFLSNNSPDPPVEPKIMDGSRLHCCSKAATERCMNLCSKTFNTEWYSTWRDFNSRCQDLSLPVSMTEAAMLNCLDEVEEPCKLGCSGLKFCKSFNFRPTQPFRSCNAQADSAAEKEIIEWEKGNLRLPQMIIPVKDIRECEPEIWKAIACALHTKPCHKKPSHLPLCRNECMYILNKCVDHSRLQKGQTVQHLCNKLSADETPGSCISLMPYITDPAPKINLQEVTTPCNPNPCPEEETCWVNRRKCRHPESCSPFVCHKACRMGDISSVLVPRHSYVRIPLYAEGQANVRCFEHQVCVCGQQNFLHRCKTIPCFRRESCVLGQTSVIKEHGSQFKLDCNHCICNEGEVICTKHKCPSSETNVRWRDLPCECSRDYQPRCGHNGKTYPNPCLAERCGRLKKNELREGSCYSFDDCQDNPCGDSYRCLPKRQVCLSINYENCPQYECVPLHEKCDHHFHDPVCDITGQEYSNPCLLLHHKRTLDYRGHCQSDCSTSEPVCGHNGETYPHECAALAARTTVDYYGECRVIGQYMGNVSKTADCSNVRCVLVKPANCRPIIPPGGCCPVCAAELRMLYSVNMVDVMTTSRPSGPITVSSILDVLSQQLMVRECDVFGYLNVETDLVVLVKPVTASPTLLQLEACIKETERIEYLIQNDSPLLKSHVTMTPLLLATLRTPGTALSRAGALSGGAGAPYQSVLLTALLVIALVRLTFS